MGGKVGGPPATLEGDGVMGSNRVLWVEIDEDTYEDMVSVLISWLHPDAQRIDGKGVTEAEMFRYPQTTVL